MGTEKITKKITKVESKENEKVDFNTKIATPMKVGAVISMLTVMYELYREGYLASSLNLSIVQSKFWWFMIFIMSISHIIYFIIWHFPKWYVRTCQNPCIHPVDLTFGFVCSGKLIQFFVCFSWYLQINGFFLSDSQDFEISWPRLVSALFLIVFGQWLNTAVWNTLGVNGVCYGFKLGRSVPWIMTFPYNIGISNPQYVGSAITNLGIASVLINQKSAEAGIFLAWMVWTVFYVFSGYVETYTGKVQGKIE